MFLTDEMGHRDYDFCYAVTYCIVLHLGARRFLRNQKYFFSRVLRFDLVMSEETTRVNDEED